ncbi:N-acetylmuramoyl-L-alanine amidase [Fulvimarina endophytica]|uniref:N-acetylmuramoyl-L-alanine amidase n=1 Tax=Fulvimarina endophytica TaxID=2293836 RepID=A0A371WZC6_9HYPH|nr:N-acetylmuramoyl-L-alanine amidase [Fulvimarina endophytica]RFC62340.1 N-acetylmuramoyl-L-alanine amidase [Fulvimarina endophytica]
MLRIVGSLLIFILASFASPADLARAETAIVTHVEIHPPVDGKQSAVFDFTSAPDARLVVLRFPDRIALDLRDALPAGDPEWDGGEGLIESVRHGATGPDRYRYIFRPRTGVEARLDRIDAESGAGARYEIVFAEAAETVIAGEPRLSAQAGSEGKSARPASSEHAAASEHQFTVVIDPGHGGEDKGAVAKNGVMEKAVNLAAAKALRDALARQPGIRIVLTREEDVFVGLVERSEIARRENADLFISLHADSIRYDDLRGATIYTLSEKASDRLSLEIAANENAADRFGGADYAPDQPEIFDILADLTRRETVGYSEHFASALLERMRRSKIRLINNPKRSAGFMVLKSPDVPSVLIEMGFMSNASDAKLLADTKWRQEIMRTVADAIIGFYGLDRD